MKFSLGALVATPACLRLCQKHQVDILGLVRRHHSGDWGDLDDEDKLANDVALVDGSRLFSAYKVGGEKVFCVTEWDRSATTLMISHEY